MCSIPCTKSETMLFAPIPEQRAVDSSTNVSYGNNSTLENASAITVVIPQEDKFIDFHDSVLNIGLKILKSGVDMKDAEDNDVAFANIPLSTIFKRVEVFLGDKQISGSDDFEAYKNYVNWETTFSANAKKHGLRCIGYAKDTTGKMDTRGADNAGFALRQGWTAKSAEVRFVGPIPSDLFLSAERLLPPNVPIRLVFKLASPEFCLLAPNATFNYKITHFEVIMRKVTLNPHLSL